MSQVLITVPADAVPGQQLIVNAAGVEILVVVPADVVPGQQIVVDAAPQGAIELSSPQALRNRTNGALPVSQTHRAYECDSRCCLGFLKIGGSYCCTITFAAIFAVLIALAGVGFIGLIVISIAPAAVVLYWAWRWYGSYLTRCTVVDVMLEATAILIIPLSFAITVLDYFLPMTTHCGAINPGAPFWRYFFKAYIRAALLEELLKYFAIRRLLYKEYIIDARAFLVYGTVSGLTFGVLENIAYALMGGIYTAIIRSFVTVPLHSMFGLMIGAALVKFRFQPEDSRLDGRSVQTRVTPVMGRELEAGVEEGGREGETMLPLGAKRVPYGLSCVKEHCSTIVPAIWLPVLLHGTYDVVLFIAAGECGSASLLVILNGPLLAFTIIRVRWLTFQIEAAFPQKPGANVHTMIREGQIERPCSNCGSCCRCCGCCY